MPLRVAMVAVAIAITVSLGGALDAQKAWPPSLQRVDEASPP